MRTGGLVTLKLRRELRTPAGYALYFHFQAFLFFNA